MARSFCRPSVSNTLRPQNSWTLSYPRYSCVAARPPVIGPEGIINQSTGHRTLPRSLPQLSPSLAVPPARPRPRVLPRPSSSPLPREARLSKKCRRADGNRITPTSSPPACQGRRTGPPGPGSGRVHAACTRLLVVRVPRGGYSQTGLLPIPNRNELSLGVS